MNKKTKNININRQNQSITNKKTINNPLNDINPIQKSIVSISELFNEINGFDQLDFDIEIISNKDKLEKFKKILHQKNMYFRGEDSRDYKLQPSIVRGYSYSKTSEQALNQQIKNFFAQKRKIYNKLIKTSEENNELEFYSFLQHVKIPTMLLDITSNGLIALSFALKKDNYRLKKDIVVYTFKVKKQDKIIRTHEIEKINAIFNNYQIKKINNDNIKEAESSNPIIIDIKTNDKMKYQKAAFLLFPQNFIYDEKSSLETKLEYKKIKNLFTVKKYIIKWRYIPELYTFIEFEHPDYTQELLENPYLNFKNL